MERLMEVKKIAKKQYAIAQREYSLISELCKIATKE